jgi:hypothetical protein
MWQERNRTADTEIFSLLLVAGLCVAIGRQLNESKRLTPPCPARFYRFKHMVPHSSGKVVTK